MAVRRPLGIVIVALLMMVFGLAEVVTAFRHQFFGLSTAGSSGSAVVGALIGLVYVAAGALALVARRWALWLTLACLGLDIAGRLAMVGTGWFSVGTPRQVLGIVAGTLIVALFGGYLFVRRSHFL